MLEVGEAKRRFWIGQHHYNVRCVCVCVRVRVRACLFLVWLVSSVYEDLEAAGGGFGEEDFDINPRGGNPLMRCCKACIHR